MKFVREKEGKRRSFLESIIHRIGGSESPEGTKTPRTRREWKEFAEYLVGKVEEALDYWCWNISPDTPADCYAGHMDLDLYDLASEFQGYSWSYVSEDEVKMLKEMPDDIYNWATRKIQRDIARAERETRKEFEEYETVYE